MSNTDALTWMNRTPVVVAPRISDETWEKYKDIILKQYQEGTLEQVINYMRETYDFKPTKRQLIHRVGQKWGLKKYAKVGGGVSGETSSSGRQRGDRARASPFQSSSLWPPTTQASVQDGQQIHDVSAIPVIPMPATDALSMQARVMFGASPIIDPLVHEYKVQDDEKLSCPYRKRNPIRFNVRDYQSCATQSYPDISQLKRHIRNVHKLRHQEHCPRCKRGFDTKEAVDTHLLAPSHEICEVLPSPPDDFENGINEATEDWLIGRRANTKIDNWKSLWNLLFPNDEVVLSYDFCPVVESTELERYIMLHLPDLAGTLKTELGEGPLDMDKLNSGLERSMNSLMKSFDKKVRDSKRGEDDKTLEMWRERAGLSQMVSSEFMDVDRTGEESGATRQETLGQNAMLQQEAVARNHFQ